jgi:hypothetical protein
MCGEPTLKRDDWSFLSQGIDTDIGSFLGLDFACFVSPRI